MRHWLLFLSLATLNKTTIDWWGYVCVFVGVGGYRSVSHEAQVTPRPSAKVQMWGEWASRDKVRGGGSLWLLPVCTAWYVSLWCVLLRSMDRGLQSSRKGQRKALNVCVCFFSNVVKKKVTEKILFHSKANKNGYWGAYEGRVHLHFDT